MRPKRGCSLVLRSPQVPSLSAVVRPWRSGPVRLVAARRTKRIPNIGTTAEGLHEVKDQIGSGPVRHVLHELAPSSLIMSAEHSHVQRDVAIITRQRRISSSALAAPAARPAPALRSQPSAGPASSRLRPPSVVLRPARHVRARWPGSQIGTPSATSLSRMPRPSVSWSPRWRNSATGGPAIGDCA